MAEIPSAEAVSLFSKWELQNKNLAILSSNPSAVVSARKAHVSLCLNDVLQLAFAEHGIMRFFIRGALFEPADPGDFSEDSKAWFAQYAQDVQIRFPNTEMQCFIFPEIEKNPIRGPWRQSEFLDISCGTAIVCHAGFLNCLSRELART